MTTCHGCGEQVEPVTALDPRFGVCEQCPLCGVPFARVAEASHLAQANAGPAPALPARPAPPPAPTPKPATPTPWGDLLDAARARLAYCEEQIAARDGFIAERDMLRRMIAAADGETRPAPATVFTN